MTEILLDKFLDVFNNDILPLTSKGVDSGNKIFGAAIIKKDDYSLVVAGSNNETENPLWHGETHTLKKFYEINKETRPDEKNCIFLSSHEPCSLCLSAITFSGFDNFYYLFPYESTSEEFSIPHDLNILKEVFNIDDGNYIKNNSYWKSYSINSLINKLEDSKKKKFKDSFIKFVNRIFRKIYMNNKVNKINLKNFVYKKT